MKRIIIFVAMAMGSLLMIQAQNTIEIKYNGNSATVTIPKEITDVTYKVDGADVILTSTTTTTEYTYNVSGVSTDGSLVVNGSYKLTLQLNGINLTNAHGGAAIDIECGKRIAVELVKGTINRLADSVNGKQKGALYFKGHPEFEGEGTLFVTGKTKHAICAKEYIELKASTGTINIMDAVSDGIHCGKGTMSNEHNYFLMKGGIVNIQNVGSDGVDSDDYGVIRIEGGSISINLSEDGSTGLKADSLILINGGNVSAVLTGKDSEALRACYAVNISGGKVNLVVPGDGSKGIKAKNAQNGTVQNGGYITIKGGDIDIMTTGGNYITIKEDEKDVDKCMGLSVDADFEQSDGIIRLTALGKEAHTYNVKGTENHNGGTFEEIKAPWTTNVMGYQYDMSAYINVEKNGIRLTDYTNLAVGAFLDEECVGYSVFPTNDYGVMRIYSNSTASKQVVFKLYEYDSDTEYELTPSSMVNFANESCVGNPGSPLVLSVIDVNAVVVTAKNYTRKYGEANPAFEFTSLGITLEGIPNISCDAIATSPVGTYTIKVGKGTVTNESVTFVDGTLTITKAPLTITAKSYTITQGEALPTFAATYSGFKNNETQSVLTKKPTFACAVPSDMTPGTYNITVSGAEAQNYDISYVKGTLTIEKKEEPEPITRSPFKGEISLPGTLEAENFDKGGEGIAYHDSDAEDHGGTNYRSGADAGVDIVTGNGGYALGWTAGGEWIEYSVNVTKAGKYTYEAIISNGTADKGGFSISLVGNDGKLTKLADVSVPSTENNWDKYQPVKGDLLQSLEAGSQIFRITITTGNCNIDRIKFDLKEEEPEPEPEPAYKVGDDITALATAEWEGKTNNYGGLANPAVERYTHAAPEDVDDILTQTVTGLRNGTYKVQLDVAASFTPDRGFTCPTGDGLSVAFANGTQRNLSVVERGWVGEGEQKIVTLTATVTDGTLKYGIKNLAPSGNWFVARLRSIVYVSESGQTAKTYAISIASEKNGTTVTDVSADEEGSRVFITATPDEDCTMESIKVTTTGGQEVEVTNNSFIMPASAVKVTATYTAPEKPDAIKDVIADDGEYEIYTLDGKQVETLQKGVNIIRMSEGSTKKVYVK
ncbi:MAG: carbohydrate-binding domain-containing protein [Bacteroidaceae bacterium]|nr:carbohydrate-binding domain-containing protein [Bacteroidaceae bacterium]